MNLAELLKAVDALTVSGARYRPHRHLLLLTIIELIQRDDHTSNRFEFTTGLRQLFSHYFDTYARGRDRDRPWTPFFHLRSSGFWHLHARPGQEELLARLSSVGGASELKQIVAYASLSEDVFSLLRDPESAEQIRRHTIGILTANREDEPRHLGIGERSSVYMADTGLSGSLFAHEDRAIREIRDKIGVLGRSLANYNLYDRTTNAYLECDLILVMRSGLYIVELKHWTGRIQVQPHQWLIDGSRYRTDPHVSNALKCKVLKGVYEHDHPTYPTLWVQSVVVLTNPEATVQNADDPRRAAEQRRQNVTLQSIDDLDAYLRRCEGLSREGARVRLSDGHVLAIASGLERAAGPRPATQFAIPGYQIVEHLAQRPERIEVLARALDGRARGLVRFRVYRPSAADSSSERARLVRVAYNTAEALDRIGDHPNIQRVWVEPNSGGDIVERCAWSEAGTLRQLLEATHGKIEQPQALDICLGLARALQAAHDAGVIHRAVKPEHVLLVNDVPRLTDFDLSFHLDRPPEVGTVLPHDRRLPDDGYTAPELLKGGDADEGADTFALGAIAYQLLTGAKPFETVRQFLADGGKLGPAALRSLADRGLPQALIKALDNTLLADPQARCRDAELLAEAFEAARQAGEPLPSDPNAELQPGDTYDVYEVLQLVGRGATAQTYRARARLDEQVAIKLYHYEIDRERIFYEDALAREISSPHIVRALDRAHRWNGVRYFSVLDYVEGETLRARIERGEHPDREAFLKAACGLLEALEAYHGRTVEGEPSPIVHGDVKPDNIMLGANGEPLLFDLSVAGPPRVDIFAGTLGYVPPDRLAGAEMQFAPDGDLFALGVTLWEWLFGARPYGLPTVGASPARARTPQSDIPGEWIAWLARAVATTAQQRYASVAEMRQALIELATAPLPQTPKPPKPEPARPPVGPLQIANTNPFVPYLNSLSNASAGNEHATAEAQANSAQFERVHVPNPLTDQLLQRLTVDRRHVILTGNAGDGKTTIAAEILERLSGRGGLTQQRVTVPAQRLTIVKDMSELPADERAGLLREALYSDGQVYLIVSNTGTLLEAARQLGDAQAAGIESELLGALEADHIVPVLGGRLDLLNVGRTDSIATACAVLERMLQAENWADCERCSLAGQCPLRANILLLQEHSARVLQRVGLAYRRLYEYGVRLTLRQMTGHLAYALTANNSCADLARLGALALEAAQPDALFSNRFFGEDSAGLRDEALQLYPVRMIRQAEFGVLLDPRLEALLWAGPDPVSALNGRALKAFRRLRGATERPSAAARRQARRLVFLFGALDGAQGDDFLSLFLRSPMLLRYGAVTRDTHRLPSRTEEEWRCQVLQVLQERYCAVKLPEKAWRSTDRLYLTLARNQLGSNTQVVLGSFATAEFEVTLQAGHRAVPNSASRLALQHGQSGASLPLDLPFLDHVARRYYGEVATEVSAFYDDRLERFKAELLRAASTANERLELLRVGQERQLQPVRVEFGPDTMEVFR